MELMDFLAHRASFAGVPFGELHRILRQLTSEASRAEDAAGLRWEQAFRASARRLHRFALQREAAGRSATAARTWLQAAATYQAASFGLHLEDGAGAAWRRRLSRLRRLAAGAYRRSLAQDSALGEAVTIRQPGPPGSRSGTAAPHRNGLPGYLRRAQRPGPGTVVLVNGLDSLCEVELHRFGQRFLERGFDVLSLALPDPEPGRGGAVGFRAEGIATAVADWLAARGLPRGGALLAAFGVSFGGHLVARLMAGDRRFRAGVAVSPAAFLDPCVMAVPRLRRMLAFTFSLDEDREVSELAGRISLMGLTPPAGRLLLLHMLQDELFGAGHVEAYRSWAGGRLEVLGFDAEHVGTSLLHHWLPEVCDWLSDREPVATRRTA